MMKKIPFLFCFLILVSIFSSCEKEVNRTELNSLYIVPLSNSSVTENLTMLYSTIPYEYPLAVGMLYPVGTEVNMTLKVENSLVDAYNKANNTHYNKMPEDSYSLEKTSLEILKDSTVSPPTNLLLRADKLDLDKSYLLAVNIESVSAKGISFNSTIGPKYYIVRVPTPEIGVLSVGKPSIFSQGYNPERANDGNTDGAWPHGSVAETGAGNEEYWEVDLESISPRIDTIEIWNRTDCCMDRTSDFYVFVSDKPINGTTVAATLAQEGVHSFYVEGQAGRPTTILPNVSGRYVRVQNTTTASLTLAEVTVIGIKP